MILSDGKCVFRLAALDLNGLFPVKIMKLYATRDEMQSVTVEEFSSRTLKSQYKRIFIQSLISGRLLIA